MQRAESRWKLARYRSKWLSSEVSEGKPPAMPNTKSDRADTTRSATMLGYLFDKEEEEEDDDVEEKAVLPSPTALEIFVGC